METTDIILNEEKDLAVKPDIKRIAIFSMQDKDGKLGEYRRYYLRKLKTITDHILVVVCGILSSESRRELEGLCDEFYVVDIENKGLYYGWIDGIEQIGWKELYKYNELLMLNDRYFGPFFPLDDMIREMEKSEADYWGVMRECEDKKMTEYHGLTLRHGNVKGSIYCFNVIRDSLLHSSEFKKYWSKDPEKEYIDDDGFFAEIDFYDYVVDAGFKAEAFQSEKLKNYPFGDSKYCISELVKDEKIPFCNAEMFGADSLSDALKVGYGNEPRKVLEYIEKNTDYDTNMIWEYILKTKNLTDIFNQLQLEYIVPTDYVKKPYCYEKKIAVIIHICCEDYIEKIADYCMNFTENTDFYITTATDKINKKVNNIFSERKLNFTSKVRTNIEKASPTLWVTYADVVTNGKYEYVCFFHDEKKTDENYGVHRDSFIERCYENLFGTNETVKNIITLFEENRRLGILGVPNAYHGKYFASKIYKWKMYYKETAKLAKKLNLEVEINPEVVPVSPYGDMFWFRTSALKKAIDKNISYSDFRNDLDENDAFANAIERIYGFCAQESGFYYGDVINSDYARSDMFNYRYMLQSLLDILISNHQWVTNFEITKEVIKVHVK